MKTKHQKRLSLALTKQCNKKDLAIQSKLNLQKSIHAKDKPVRNNKEKSRPNVRFQVKSNAESSSGYKVVKNVKLTQNKEDCQKKACTSKNTESKALNNMENVIIIAKPNITTISEVTINKKSSGFDKETKNKIECKHYEEENGRMDNCNIKQVKNNVDESNISFPKANENMCTIELLGISDDSDMDKDSIATKGEQIKSCTTNSNFSSISRKILTFTKNDDLCSAKDIHNSSSDDLLSSKC